MKMKLYVMTLRVGFPDMLVPAVCEAAKFRAVTLELTESELLHDLRVEGRANIMLVVNRNELAHGAKLYLFYIARPVAAQLPVVR